MVFFKNLGGGFEVRIDNRQVFLLIFTVLILIVTAFAVGYAVGRAVSISEASRETPREISLPKSPTPTQKIIFSEPTEPAVPEVITKPTPRPQPSPSPTVNRAARVSYAVQVGALNKWEQAAAMVDRLKSMGYGAYLNEKSQGGTTIYRVRIGPYPSQEEAAENLPELRAKITDDAWIVKEE